MARALKSQVLPAVGAASHAAFWAYDGHGEAVEKADHRRARARRLGKEATGGGAMASQPSWTRPFRRWVRWQRGTRSSGAMHYDLKRSMEDGSLDHSLIATANNEWAEVHGRAARVRGDKESVQAWSQVGAIAA